MSETLNISLTVNAGTTGPGALDIVDANNNPLADGADVVLQPETQGVADPGQEICTVSGGTAPYDVALASGALPVGVNITSVDNADASTTFSVSGTPTESGEFDFALTVSDSATPPATANLRARSAQPNRVAARAPARPARNR